MYLKKTLLASAFLALAGLASTAMAATNPAQTTFQVQLKINKACSVSATNLNFGTQDSTAVSFAQSTAGSVTVTCSKKTAYIVGLAPSNGNTVGAGSMAGQTSGNTDTVAYQLYSNAALSTVWGNTGTLLSPGNGVSGIGTGSAQTPLSVYAQVLAANVTPDNYLDTVTVNVTY